MASTARTASRLQRRDGLRSLTSLFRVMEVNGAPGPSSPPPRTFSTSRKSLQQEEQGQPKQQEHNTSAAAAASASSSSAFSIPPSSSSSSSGLGPIPDFAAMLKSSEERAPSTSPVAPNAASSTSTSASTSTPFPSSSSSNRIVRDGAAKIPRGPLNNSAAQGQPYKLHAHCTKHNTILSFTKSTEDSIHDLTDRGDAVTMLNNFRNGITLSGNDVTPKWIGQTVLRTSPGMLGLRKGQRGSFEAATRASLQMFTLIRQLGEKDRTTKHGQKVRDPPASTIELVLKGFGPGREALVAALGSAPGEEIKRKVKKITDATPLKIGGVRPKKRRKLSPPLDLGRRRR